MPSIGFNTARDVNGVFSDACRCRVKCVFVHSLARLASYGLPNIHRMVFLTRVVHYNCTFKDALIHNSKQEMSGFYQNLPKRSDEVSVSAPLMCVAII